MAILVVSAKEREYTRNRNAKGDTIVTLKQDSIVYSDSIKLQILLLLPYSDKILVFFGHKESYFRFIIPVYKT